MPKTARVVILGGGFGGVAAARAFGRLKRGLNIKPQVTLISDRSHFLFTPLLHEVATGAIGHENLLFPLRVLVGRGVDNLVLAKVLGVDTLKQKVETSHGYFEYDYLILALGSRSFTFGVSGADDYAWPLKTLVDAEALRSHLMRRLEAATLAKDAETRHRALRFVIVGGGPLGVELAPEVCEFLNDWAPTYPTLVRKQMEVHLVHSGQKLVEQFGPKFHDVASKIFNKHCLKAHYGARVIKVTPFSVILSTGEVIEADTIIWTAGVKPNDFMLSPKDIRASGRCEVLPTLQVKDCGNIYAVGDGALLLDAQGKPLPATAQVAVEQGPHAARNIIASIGARALKSFKYRHKGFTISLGQGRAVVDLGIFVLTGGLAWLIYRGIYLYKLGFNEGRVRVFFDWFLDLFFRRRGGE